MSGAAQIDPNRLLAQAEAAFGAGRLDEADRQLAQLSRMIGPHSAPLHLSALIAKRRGRLEDALALFERALALAPEDPQILSNYGNLLGELGRLDDAVAAYDRALAAAPTFDAARLNRAVILQRLERHEEVLAQLEMVSPQTADSAQALSLQGLSLLALGRLQDAAQAFDSALVREPRRAKALVGRARVAMLRGEKGAVELLEQAVALQPGGRSVVLQYAEALETVGDERAIPMLEEAVRQEPDWPEGQRTLARMRWEAGDTATFTRGIEDRLAQAPHNLDLWLALAEVFGSADLHADAASAARRARQAVGDQASLLALEAIHSSEAGNVEAADRAFAILGPASGQATMAEARHRLRTGEWDRAQQLVGTEFARDPWSVRGWALQGLLWRLGSDPRADWLHGQANLFAARQLDLDSADLLAIAECLRALHKTRAHPLGQSLRGGTQTRGRLFERMEPEVRLLRGAILRTLEEHWADLPPLDERHPLLRHRERNPHFAGSWSVRLTDGGFHVAHIHPRGVLSSACYLVVPRLQERQGHLEIGGPPPELGLDLPALTSFEPVPGRLILFPSTMYHGTRPFPVGERLTAAFDVVAR